MVVNCQSKYYNCSLTTSEGVSWEGGGSGGGGGGGGGEEEAGDVKDSVMTKRLLLRNPAQP